MAKSGPGEFICEPKVHYFYDQPPEPSSDEEFDYEPIDFFHKGIHGGKPEPLRIFQREEHTLCLLKPCVFPHAAKITRIIRQKGFTILKRRVVTLFPEQAAAFYTEHYGRAWFPKTMLRMSEGPVVAMILAKENAVEDFKILVGPVSVEKARQEDPFSLRAQFGLKGDLSTNGIHASDSVKNAKKEILFFFKHANPEPLQSVQDKMDYIEENFESILLDGLTQLCKIRPINPAIWLKNYLAANESAKPMIAMPEWPPVDKKEIDIPDDIIC